MTNREPLLVVEDLVKHYPAGSRLLLNRGGAIKAVDGVSFTLARGETLGLVGESGCGKSTTGKVIVNLEQAQSGRIQYDGLDLLAVPRRERLAVCRRIQMIFQDPYGSLNQRMTVHDIVAEPLIVHSLFGSREDRRRRVEELLELVGLDPVHANRYPHEFSGGQRQRIGIARALAVEPELIICDEPVSALDVSIQAQVINLLKRLQKQYGLTYLFIAHDLSVVKHISDRVAVMYLGKIVELADKTELFSEPLHPYTQALLSSIPVPSPDHERKRIILKGELPSPSNPPHGCRFNTRCPLAQSRCFVEEPEFREIKPGHFAACHFV